MKYIFIAILFGFFTLHPFLMGAANAFEVLAAKTIFPVTQVVAADVIKTSSIAVSQVSNPQNIFKVWLTAYASVPEETDDTPFVTASGHLVRDGIVATNFLPFGTLVKIPEVFGDKVFTVDDRMNRSKEGFMDVWMPSKQEAINFGIKETKIVVVSPTLASAKN